MREILFRGKRIDNGEWVEGYFFKWPCVSWKELSCVIVPVIGLENGIAEQAIADHATIGQYTGLTDKNGKKIFEGDILQIAKKSDTLGTYFFPPVKYPINVVVKWDLCAWMWEVQGKEGPYYIHFPDAWCHYECKVIGNMHDNPELLEGE